MGGLVISANAAVWAVENHIRREACAPPVTAHLAASVRLSGWGTIRLLVVQTQRPHQLAEARLHVFKTGNAHACSPFSAARASSKSPSLKAWSTSRPCVTMLSSRRSRVSTRASSSFSRAVGWDRDSRVLLMSCCTGALSQSNTAPLSAGDAGTHTPDGESQHALVIGPSRLPQCTHTASP